MSASHKPWRFRKGHVNYRGFCFERDGKQWVFRDEDGGIFKARPTIKSMCAYIDRNHKQLSRS